MSREQIRCQLRACWAAFQDGDPARERIELSRLSELIEQHAEREREIAAIGLLDWSCACGNAWRGLAQYVWRPGDGSVIAGAQCVRCKSDRAIELRGPDEELQAVGS